MALPVFLYEVLGWSFSQIGVFMAVWIIGYGIVQASAPTLLKRNREKQGPGGGTARFAALVLALLPAAIAIALNQNWPADVVLIVGLILFGIVFAVNSAVHSYLILAYSDHDKVALSVGFYYMANAGGRLIGTVLSGWVYQLHGLQGCLLLSSVFVLMAAFLSFALPPVKDKNSNVEISS